MQYITKSNEELVKLFQNGDVKAFEILFGRIKDDVFTYIYSHVQDEDEANDIFQETFFKVINSLKKSHYNEEGKFKNWVFRIAHNLIIDYYRKNNKMGVVSGEGEKISLFSSAKLADHKNIETQIISIQINKKVKDLLKYLPEEQREVVIMRHFVGMSFKEIAENLDISINTALGRMRYALINLRKIIKKYDIDLYAY
jgi:RNA polymerase sigma factor (sigma-70 family)